MGPQSTRALRMPGEARRRGGFTLMELLVSLSLIGLVAVFIQLGFRIGISAREKAEAALRDVQRTEAALDLLSRQIGSMVFYVARLEHEGAQLGVLLFQSSPQSLSFVAPYSATSGSAAGLRFVQYFVARSKDGESRMLLLNERPLPRDSQLLGSVVRGISRAEDNRLLAELVEPERGPDSLTLVPGLSSAAFRTLARLEEESPAIGSRAAIPGRSGLLSRMARGRSAPTDRAQLPAGVRLRLTWEEEGPFGSKEFAIAVPVQGS